MLIEVTLKNGKVIKCLPREKEILEKYGRLKSPKKDIKAPGVTKELKEEGQTKEEKPKTISTRNVKGASPKGVK